MCYSQTVPRSDKSKRKSLLKEFKCIVRHNAKNQPIPGKILSIVIKIKPVKKKNSTHFYRKKKETNTATYSCPYCSYSTYYAKSNLQSHIINKHKTYSDRPFKCSLCPKAYCQQSGLRNHIQRVHSPPK